jgi:hypothetical protein
MFHLLSQQFLSGPPVGAGIVFKIFKLSVSQYEESLLPGLDYLTLLLEPPTLTLRYATQISFDAYLARSAQQHLEEFIAMITDTKQYIPTRQFFFIYQGEELPELLALHVAVEVVAANVRVIHYFEGKAFLRGSTLSSWHTLHQAVVNVEVAWCHCDNTAE